MMYVHVYIYTCLYVRTCTCVYEYISICAHIYSINIVVLFVEIYSESVCNNKRGELERGIFFYIHLHSICTYECVRIRV